MAKKKQKAKLSKRTTLIVGLSAAAILSIGTIIYATMFAATPPPPPLQILKGSGTIKISMKVDEGGTVTRVAPKNATYDPLKQMNCKTGNKGVCVDKSTFSATQTLTYKASPEKCYVFVKWEYGDNKSGNGKFGGGSTSKENPISVSRKVSHNIVAHFRHKTQAEISATKPRPACPTF